MSAVRFPQIPLSYGKSDDTEFDLHPIKIAKEHKQKMNEYDKLLKLETLKQVSDRAIPEKEMYNS